MRTVVAACLLVLTGCTAHPTSPPGAVPTPGPAATTSSARPPSGSKAGPAPGALLAQVRFTRRDGAIRFRALWVPRDGGRSHRVLVTGDGSHTTRTWGPDDRALRHAFPPTSPTHAARSAAVMGRLLPLEVTSFARGTRVLVGGGDGATLLPFERVARSEEYDDWSVQRLPRFDGARAYVTGAVALGDGRLVALLEHFSDDRGGRPSARHHGLWASSGENWSSYAPLSPRFTPPLASNPDGWSGLVGLGASMDPDPVVWVTTWDQRVYVSTDAMRTFREADAR